MMIGEMAGVIAQATQPGGGEAPLIDWVTVAAQILNFIILVVILKFLLYDRVIRAMDRRQEKIESRLAEARQTRSQAEQEKEQFTRQRQELDRQRDEMLAAAKRKAEQRRQELERQARQDVSEQRRRWQESLQRQRDDFLAELRRQAADHLCQAARKVLADLADADLEKQVASVFRRRLEELDDETRRALAEAAGSSDEPLIVASAWELPDEHRQGLARAVRDRLALGEDASLDFRTDADLLCGIELRVKAHRLGWNAADYLDELAGAIQRALDEQAHQAKAAEETSQEPQAEDEPETPQQDQPDEGEGPQ